MFYKLKKNKPKIIVIGNSKKFISIFESIYKKSNIKKYSWRSIIDLDFKEQKLFKNPKVIFICGYDYKSQWYLYEQYYHRNVSLPFKLVKFLVDDKTKIIYIDTISKVLDRYTKKKRKTFSRYEFAKKELRTKLQKNFKNLKILEIPPIKAKNEILIHGSFFTKFIFKILIKLNLIKTIDISKIKKKLIINLNSRQKLKIYQLRPILLSIPRSLFLDRLARLILD